MKKYETFNDLNQRAIHCVWDKSKPDENNLRTFWVKNVLGVATIKAKTFDELKRYIEKTNPLKGKPFAIVTLVIETDYRGKHYTNPCSGGSYVIGDTKYLNDIKMTPNDFSSLAGFFTLPNALIGLNKLAKSNPKIAQRQFTGNSNFNIYQIP